MVPARNGGREVATEVDFGKVYFKVTDKGEIMEPVHASMRLYVKTGQIYTLQGKPMISASGYRYLNKIASISIVKPQHVIVGDKPVFNPNIERDPRTKAVECVNIRAMGIGFSPTGNVVIIDKTLFFNIYTYFIQTLQAKMKESPKCALYGNAKQKPTTDGRWVFYLVEAPVGIWADVSSQPIMDALKDHTQRQRFGERIATTIVERNILKDHPAIAASGVILKPGEFGEYANVSVHGWRASQTARDISDIMAKVEKGDDEAKDFEIKREVVTVVTAEEEAEAIAEAKVDDGSAGAEHFGDPRHDEMPPDAFFEKQRQDAAAAKPVKP